jgi:hypothetical protein
MVSIREGLEAVVVKLVLLVNTPTAKILVVLLVKIVLRVLMLLLLALASVLCARKANTMLTTKQPHVPIVLLESIPSPQELSPVQIVLLEPIMMLLVLVHVLPVALELTSQVLVILNALLVRLVKPLPKLV